jgi:AhpD family alkylhydroperoxidase
MDAAVVPPVPSPCTFTSLREAAADIVALWMRAPVLAGVYLGRMLDPGLRERIMVAVSRVNACAGCTWVHERWALRAGVPTAELEAIGLGDLARLDDRSRAAIVYAAALAENRFRGTADRELAALAGRHLTAAERRAVEAVARMMALANLSASTLGRMSRVGGRQAGPGLAGGRPPHDAALLSGGPAATVQRSVERRRELARVPASGGQRDKTHGAGRPPGEPADDHGARDQRHPASSRSSSPASSRFRPAAGASVQAAR